MKLIINVKLKIEQHRIATVRDNFLLRANLLMSLSILVSSMCVYLHFTLNFAIFSRYVREGYSPDDKKLSNVYNRLISS